MAGATGTLLRYFSGTLVQTASGHSFPWGTLTVNMTGCFLFGIIWASGGKYLTLSPEIKGIILTGFMGAFTTFSTFAFDTQGLYKASGIIVAGANVGIHAIAGVVLVIAGITLGARL